MYLCIWAILATLSSVVSWDCWATFSSWIPRIKIWESVCRAEASGSAVVFRTRFTQFGQWVNVRECQRKEYHQERLCAFHTNLIPGNFQNTSQSRYLWRSSSVSCRIGEAPGQQWFLLCHPFVCQDAECEVLCSLLLHRFRTYLSLELQLQWNCLGPFHYNLSGLVLIVPFNTVNSSTMFNVSFCICLVSIMVFHVIFFINIIDNKISKRKVFIWWP